MDLKLQRYARINVFLALTTYVTAAVGILLCLTQGVVNFGHFELMLFGVQPYHLGEVSFGIAAFAAISGFGNAVVAERAGYPDLGADNPARELVAID